LGFGKFNHLLHTACFDFEYSTIDKHCLLSFLWWIASAVDDPGVIRLGF
jgi:hypothetical protein